MAEDNTKKEERRRRQEEQTRKSNAYMLALGKFVSMFSHIETHLQSTFWKIAGVPEPTAQAVFSGVRVDGCMQFIGRIADAQNWEKSKKVELEYIFSQLRLINKLRNDILHYGATSQHHESENIWLITNKALVHIPEKIHELKITPKALEEALFDMIMIVIRLVFLTRREDLGEGAKSIEKVLKVAWLYKPPQQDQPDRKSRKARQKQSHPPDASQA